VEAGVDAFRREMSALSPDAAPIQRRVEPGSAGDDRGSERSERPERPVPPERFDGAGAPRATPRRPPGSGPDRAP
jgi:hypothetical protein